MASLATIKTLHENVGRMEANKITPTLLRWYRATTKYIARCEFASSQTNQKNEGDGHGRGQDPVGPHDRQ